ncbi:acyl-coA-binding protein [Nitzschia inconspicua]|uniref:Acyl-coA-binding protein n=1 Tax=Nitzschia inconspicua TaxID=303405 RepID=A0A9K3PYE9_9STRA|nr:acyl-coA-binding protein [Nitzschia inconspicua]
MSTEDLESKFQAAAEKARVTENVSTDNKKKLYSLFKQATEGPIGDRPRPGIFDQVGRAKWDSWAGLKDMSAEDAKKQYIALVDSL